MKLTHYFQLAACLAVCALSWALANAADFSFSANVTAGLATALTVAKTLAGLFSSSATAPAAKMAAKVSGGAVLVFALAVGASTVEACHETPQAAIAQAIDLTDAVCSVAPDSPVGQPWVDVICQVAEGGESIVSVIINALDSDGGSTSTAAIVPMETIRLRMPTEQAPAFLAQHKGKGARK